MKIVKHKAKSVYNGEEWEGFYVYSQYEDKHFIVQDAVKNLNGSGYSFAHWAEVDPETIEVVLKE